MRKEEYEAGVDELAGTPIEAIMFCLGEGRTMLHDTKEELWGTPTEKWPHLGFRRANKHLEIGARGDLDPDARSTKYKDFKHEEAREWIDQGIVDVLVGEEFHRSTSLSFSFSNPAIDFTELVEAARGTDCRVHAAGNSSSRPAVTSTLYVRIPS